MSDWYTATWTKLHYKHFTRVLIKPSMIHHSGQILPFYRFEKDRNSMLAKYIDKIIVF